MVTNLGCIGLATPDDERLFSLVTSIGARADPLPELDGMKRYRWQDISGARVSIGLRGGELEELIPSFAGHQAARIGTVMPASEDIYVAELIDVNGDVITSAHLEPEDKALFAAASSADKTVGEVCITALGVEVTVFEDAESFKLAKVSIASSTTGAVDAFPAIPMAAESFLSLSSFDDETPEAYALLNGLVLGAKVLTNGLTQQTFVAADVRCIGFDVTLCFPQPDGAEPPKAGNIISGTVYLIASNASYTLERIGL